MADHMTVAPAFVEMAHRIVWCTVATVDPAGRPRTRVLHPIWELDDGAKRAGWERFAQGPAPVGCDPRLIPQWTGPDVERFGILRLEPYTLRVQPGSLMTEGRGELLTWHA